MEKLLDQSSKDPDRLTNLFIETTDDLSFSRTYYPNRSVRVYLNTVAQQVFQIIYKNKSREKGRFRKFWLNDIPLAMWFSRFPFLYSFLIFATGFSIGVFSSIHYPEFARIILGDYYIQLTEANISKGDPMAIYGDSPQISMFIQIAWNNIKILFWTYVMGLLFGIGTIYIVLYNSIMVGTFIYFFIERNLFEQCFYAVMLHGTIELSMIIIGGAAGLTLGRGLIFPGTHSRLQGLLVSARQSIKILLAASIFLLIAAFIESFATRYTGIPNLVRGFIIFLSAVIVIGYFVVYPYIKFRKSEKKISDEAEVFSSGSEITSLQHIKSNGRVFTEVFGMYSHHWKKVMIWSSLAAIISFAFYFFKFNQDVSRLIDVHSVNYLPWFIKLIWVWGEYATLFSYHQWPLIFIFHVVVFAALTTIYSATSYKQLLGKKSSVSHLTLQFISNILLAMIALFPVFLPSGITFLILIFTLPIFLLASAVSIHERRFMAIGRSLVLLSGSYWKMIGLFITCLGVQWLTVLVITAPMLYLIFEIVSINFSSEFGSTSDVITSGYVIIMLFVLLALLPLSVFASHLFYFSSVEIKEARHLKEQIQTIGFKKRAYGLEKES